MHLHTHLKDCILDYGPLHGFWLFSYERFNGILGQQPNNNRSIEVQLLNRFLRDIEEISIQLPEQFNEEFSPLFCSRRLVGTVSDTLNSTFLPPSLDIEGIKDWSIETGLLDANLPSYSSRGILSSTERGGLRELYSRLYSVSPSVIEVNAMFIKYKINGKQLGAHNSRSCRSSIVMCNWEPILSATHPNESTHEDRPARINFFAQHRVLIQNKYYTHLLFSASFFKHHSKKMSCGSPITVWEHDIFDISGISSLVPVQFIKCRTVTLVDHLDDSSGCALFVIPIVDF